ncbi:MAG: hypothetical protein IPP02_16240 [Chitinophagaceae bacterium]|nr:hypothetical protein [Chitinophagaceae bacterium]
MHKRLAFPGPVTVTRTAAQWTKLNTSGTFADGGRIEDLAATATSGSWYIYPTISVNSNDDVVVGFTKLDGTSYPSVGYAFRYGTDPAGTMQDPVIYKAGEDYYQKRLWFRKKPLGRL